MATKAKAKETPAPSKSTAVAKWDEELARQAQIAAAVEESTATGQFFSLKSGVLSFNDNPMPDNQMAVVILDSILENVFYDGPYDPDNVQAPRCFAFGRDEKTMEPHKIVVEAGNSMAGASGGCAGCEMNEWGSADKGRGKACRNTRRLAMIPAGNFDPNTGKFKAFTDPDQFESSPIGFLKLPVTSVKGYAAFVKQVAGALKRPPFGIFARVAVKPDPNTQFKVVFEPLGQVPDNLMGLVMSRREEAVASIESPYSLPEEEEAKPARGPKGKPTPAARGGRASSGPAKKRY